MERADLKPIAEFIDLLARRAEAFANQAGVGGMETAGGLISYLASHPEDLEPFLNGGIFELPMDWCVQGCLTHHALNGKIVHPEVARRDRAVKKLAREMQHDLYDDCPPVDYPTDITRCAPCPRRNQEPPAPRSSDGVANLGGGL